MPDQDTPSEPPSQPSTPRKPKPKSSRAVEARPSWIPRPMHAAVAFVLLLTAGWAAYQVVHRQSQVDDNAELADLEGFESPDISVDETDPADGAPSKLAPSSAMTPFTQGGTHRVAAWSGSSDAAGDAALAPPPPLPGVQSAIFEQNPTANSLSDPSSGAWLLGTIEADEAADSVPLPPLARGPLNGPALR